MYEKPLRKNKALIDLNPKGKSSFHPVDVDGTARSEFTAGFHSDWLKPRQFWFFNILIITRSKGTSKISA